MNVELLKNGDLIHRRGQGDEVVEPTSVLGLLNESLGMGEGVTLRSFFRMMEKYPVLAEIEAWTHAYLHAIQSLPDVGCRKDMDWLEVGRRIDTKVSSKTPSMVFEERNEEGFTPVHFEYEDKPYSHLSRYVSLSGKRWDDHESYALTMTPLVEILDVELTLGQCQVFAIHEGTLSHDSFEDYFTLNEVINAVMTDIAFLGLDEDKKAEEDRLKEKVQGMDRRRKMAKFKVIDGGKEEESGGDDTKPEA